MGKEQFLGRLPLTVIKNGKVIAIRSEINKLVGGHSAGGSGSGGEGSAGKEAQLVSTPADALLSTLQRNHAGPRLPPPPSRGGDGSSRPSSAIRKEIATLQVKSEDGQQTFILKLQYDDTIWNLRKYINEHRAKLAAEQGKPAPSGAYEIRSAFPTRVYTEAKETLREVGLVPNATLYLK